MLHAEHFDARALDRGLEGFDPLIVDRGRNAAQDDDLAAIRQLFLEIFAGDAAEGGVVAGNVEVLDPLLGKTAIDDRDEFAGIGDALDRTGQRIGFEGQDDQRIDIAGRHHVLDIGDLLAGIAGGGKHEIEIGIGLLQGVDGFLGVEVDAAGPAMGRRGDGDADGRAVAVLGAGGARQGEACGDKRPGREFGHGLHDVFPPKFAMHPHAPPFRPRCRTTARMMMTPWIAPLR